jgi:hypothetical protein
MTKKLVPGTEHWSSFYKIIRSGKKKLGLLHYSYCFKEGVVFTCVARSLKEARVKRDSWLDRNGYINLPDEQTLLDKGELLSTTTVVRAIIKIYKYQGRYFALEKTDDGLVTTKLRAYK